MSQFESLDRTYLQILMRPMRVTCINGRLLQLENIFVNRHYSAPKDLITNFAVLKKCRNKFDFLVYEMFFINELRPSLKVQSDSIRCKFF